MKRCLAAVYCVVLMPLVFASAGFAADREGEVTYRAKCQMCHGERGLGDTAAGKSMRVRPFTDPEVSRMSEAALVNITKNGRGKMPAYKDRLTDAQIKEVVEYIEKNFIER
jgi:cytochrome c6